MTPDDDVRWAEYLRSARTNTPEQDAEIALRHDRYDPTAEELFQARAHEPFPSAA